MDAHPAGPDLTLTELLTLGENLVSQSDAIHLRDLLCKTVAEKFNCSARLWFCEPFYPLPGEPEVETIPTSPAPTSVNQCLESKQPVISLEASATSGEVLHVAVFPILTQGNPLAVLSLSRHEHERFSPEEVDQINQICAMAALALQVNRQSVLKNWRYEQISLVRSVSSQIANVLDLDELCVRVTNLIQCSFNYYHVSIFTLNESTHRLEFRASSLNCEPNQKNPLSELDYDEGLVALAARNGEELVIKDVSQEPRYRKVDALPDTKAEVVLPLKIEDRILGVLDIQSNRLGAFHENDMLVVRSLADSIALAIETTRLFNSLEQRATQMNALAEIGSAISSILDLDDLLKKVVEVIEKRFSIPFVYVFSNHSNRRKVIFEAGTGPIARKLKPNSFAFDLDAEVGIIPFVARTGQTRLVNNVENEPIYLPAKYFPQKIKSELTIPLKFGDDVLGVLDLQSDELNRFSQSDLELFESLSSGIAQSIRNASLYRTEKWRRRVADSFRDIAGLLSSNLALPDMLDRVLAALEANLPCDASAIWLLDEESTLPIEERPLQLAAVRGVSQAKVIDAVQGSVSVRTFLHHGVSSDQLTIRRPEDPYGPLGMARKFKSNYSSLAVPLRSGEEILGVLTIAHRKEGRYGSEASAIALTLASYAAVAIQNARLFTSAQEEAWSSTVLLQVAEAIQSINNLDSLFSTMVRLIPLLVGVEHSAAYLIRSDEDSFELIKAYGFQPAEDERIVQDADAIAFLKLKATLAPVFITDPKMELGLNSIPYVEDQSTLVLLPLIAHGELHGALLVSHIRMGQAGMANRFNEQTLAILQGIAQQTAIGLENIQLLENRQEEAYITAVLLQVAQAVVSQNKLEDILDTIVQLMPILVGVDTCVIYLWEQNNCQLVPIKAIAPSHADREEILHHPFSRGDFPLLDKVLETNEVAGCLLEIPDFAVKNWDQLQCDDENSLHPRENSNWLLGFPLSIKGERYGIMLTRETNVQPAYHQKRIELIKGVAQQTALAIQNERLKEEMVGRERMEREFQLARQIQRTFLPQSTPSVEGWDIDLRWRTAREVGGDFYDIFSTQENKLAFVIADVSDKGMPAALYMTVTRTLIRAAAQTLNSPAEILARVNDLLVGESQNGMFVTAIYALLDPTTGELSYANAGHNLPLLFRGESQEIEKLAKGEIALGVIEHVEYKNHAIQLNEKDTLLLYTDGLTEAFSSSGEQFSESRVIAALQENLYRSANELLESLENLINVFRKGEPPSDDLTMLAIHRLKNNSN